MSNDHPKRDSMSIEEMMIFNTSRLAALIEELQIPTLVG